jgi:hypothetical protein
MKSSPEPKAGNLAAGRSQTAGRLPESCVDRWEQARHTADHRAGRTLARHFRRVSAPETEPHEGIQ